MPIEELWTKYQRNWFAKEVLLTGNWFLECRPNFVSKEGKHLVPVSEPSAARAAPMETDLNDDDDEAFQPDPAPKPKVQRPGKVCSCDDTVMAAPPVVAPPAGVQVAERTHLASTQASQPTVSNPPSPRRSNMDVDSSQTLHVTHSGRGIPPSKGLGASSYLPFKSTLPMFLEQKNFYGLLNQSEHQQFMDRQLVQIVDHIIKVTSYHISLTLSLWKLYWTKWQFLLSVTHVFYYSYSHRSGWGVLILVSRCKCGLGILDLISWFLTLQKTWSCLSSPHSPYHCGTSERQTTLTNSSPSQIVILSMTELFYSSIPRTVESRRSLIVRSKSMILLLSEIGGTIIPFPWPPPFHTRKKYYLLFS